MAISYVIHKTSLRRKSGIIRVVIRYLIYDVIHGLTATSYDKYVFITKERIVGMKHNN